MKPEYTKQIIADALKELSKTKQISKITIKEIASQCHFNPGTFYYHFLDKADLIRWIVKTDIEGHFNETNNKIWTNNTYRLLTILKRDCAFYKQCLEVNTDFDLRKIIYDLNYRAGSEFLNHQIKNRKISEDAKEFYLAFWCSAFTETSICYILNGAKISPEKMLLYYYDMSEPYFTDIIETFIKNDSCSGMMPIQK